MGDFHALFDGSFGEHVRFPEEVPLIVQHFQRGKQEEGVVCPKGRAIGTGIDDAVFGGETVIYGI